MNSYPTLNTMQNNYKGKPVNFLQEDDRFHCDYHVKYAACNLSSVFVKTTLI